MNRSTFALGFAVTLIAAPALADGQDADQQSTATHAQPAELASARTATSAPESADAKSADEPTVMLHVKSDAVVAIEREDTGELVCTSPCDKPVSQAVRYRIGGARPSESFVLDAHGGEAKIAVDAASRRGFWTGIGVLGAGAALAAGGVIALAVGYANQGPVPGADGTVTDTTYSDTMILGTTLVVAGVAAGIYGGATFASNLRSRVTGNVVKDPPARGNAQPLRTASAHDSTWSAGPTIFVPILRGAF